MIRAIRSERIPNLLLLRYSPAWSVIDLILVPSFFFTEAAIEKRKPLAVTARRAGWVGCNILLDNIPIDGRIALVSAGVVVNPTQVRQDYERIRPLGTLKGEMRGWTLDVLNVLRKFNGQDISLSDVYGFERQLQAIHPNNNNIRAKIRQQLQVLRDLGFLAFEGKGRYRVLR